MDRQKILKVFQRYHVNDTKPSAPPLEEASAPPFELLQNGVAPECVICMDSIVSKANFQIVK